MLGRVRILFTTVALSGHFFPLVPLAWAARSLGHEVLVATPDNFVGTVLGAGLPAASCGPPADFFELTPDEWISSSVEERRHANGRTFGAIAVRSLVGTLRLVDSWRPDLVVSERAEFAGPIAAAARGVPCINLQWGVAALDEYRSAAAKELARDLEILGFDGLPSPAGVLNPWPPSLRLPHAAGHHGVRHVSYNGDARVPAWVWEPRDRPRICLTLGTVVPRLGPDAMPDTVIPMLDALGGVGVEVVVLVEDKIVAGWPPLPPAVRHAGRMPLAQVLAACDVAVHHAGQGTALTALDAGVPQLVLPVFDDQLDNASAVVRAGAGLRLLADELTPSAVAECCIALLDGPRFGRAAVAVATEIAAQPSPVEVVGTLEELMA